MKKKTYQLAFDQKGVIFYRQKMTLQKFIMKITTLYSQDTCLKILDLMEISIKCAVSTPSSCIHTCGEHWFIKIYKSEESGTTMPELEKQHWVHSWLNLVYVPNYLENIQIIV